MSRITITDLARITGYSKTTISHVINKTQGARIRSDTRERILDAAHEHNYVPNFFARNIISGRTGYLGFLTHDLESASLSGELRGAEEACRGAGYHLAVFHAVRGAGAEGERIETMIRQGVEAIYADHLDDPLGALERIRLFNIHLALGEEHESRPETDCVFEETRQGFEQLAEKLEALGHRSAAVVSSESPVEEDLKKLALEALRARGLAVHAASAPPCPWPKNFDWLRSDSAAPTPTAAICLKASIGLGILTHLMSQGLAAPRDMSVVAAGGEHSLIEFLRPGLSFLQWPSRERAKRAVERLIARLNAEPGATMAPLRLGLAPEWFEGQTLGPAPDRPGGDS